MSNLMKLRCTRCRTEMRAHGKFRHGTGKKAYGEVEVIRFDATSKSSVWCECQICGNKYKTTSKTAVKMMLDKEKSVN